MSTETQGPSFNDLHTAAKYGLDSRVDVETMQDLGAPVTPEDLASQIESGRQVAAALRDAQVANPEAVALPDDDIVTIVDTPERREARNNNRRFFRLHSQIGGAALSEPPYSSRRRG
jgi:hypothetical protein